MSPAVLDDGPEPASAHREVLRSVEHMPPHPPLSALAWNGRDGSEPVHGSRRSARSLLGTSATAPPQDMCRAEVQEGSKPPEEEETHFPGPWWGGSRPDELVGPSPPLHDTLVVVPCTRVHPHRWEQGNRPGKPGWNPLVIDFGPLPPPPCWAVRSRPLRGAGLPLRGCS